MARIKMGAVVVDIRGKLGGHVFSKNRGGAYMRTKVTPSNPRTSDQMANRALLGSLSQAWSNTTENVRISWNNAVLSWVSTNVFGDTVKPSGKNLFVALQKNVSSAGFGPLTDAPEKVEMPIVNFNLAQINIALGTILLQNDGAGTNFAFAVRATPALTSGTYNFKNRLRTIIVANSMTVENDMIYAAYVNKFGVPSAGQNIHFELRLIANNGQISVPETQKATFI